MRPFNGFNARQRTVFEQWSNASGIAQATQIISQRLTGAYLQYEAIKAQQATINSPNHTTICIRVGLMGVPIVGNLNVSPNPNHSARESGTAK